MAYRTMWEIEVRHDELGKYRHIRGSDKYIVEQKAIYQKLQWNEQWQRKLEAEQRVQEKNMIAKQKLADRERLAQDKEQTAQEKARLREEAQRYKDDRKQEGLDRDSEVKTAIETLKNCLNHALKVNDAIDWNRLKDKTKFKEPSPKLKLPPFPAEQPNPIALTPKLIPPKPVPAIKPNAPERSAAKYRPVLGFFDRLFASHKAQRITEAEILFQQDHATWIAQCAMLDEGDINKLRKWEEKRKSIENKNAALQINFERATEQTKTENLLLPSRWEKECDQIRTKHSEALQEWEQRKKKFYEFQAETNAAVDQSRANYMLREQGAVSDYCDSVLSNSIYPDYFPKEWDMDYNADTRTVVVEYALPAPDILPSLKGVQYIQSKDAFKETFLSEKEREALYESLLYQITLRTIHELFEADTAGAVDAVAFSGIVTAMQKNTGHNATACVLSVLALKEQFLQINLAGVDPKACFKTLKGVAASKLAGLTPVSPIVMLNKDDRRFVANYGVAEHIDNGTNLATMDWEDFEHLIREVFEQEFSTSGGEVKVTQASRDGGVDAVAFDPDPIRGGKIVIQAKRYSNTVGVSAVRDLYGTVMNEGATKGILVTTADYGPDAYEFAKGKPLSLLNGSNLLYLLEKHGRQARINLYEARQENRQAL